MQPSEDMTDFMTSRNSMVGATQRIFDSLLTLPHQTEIAIVKQQYIVATVRIANNMCT